MKKVFESIKKFFKKDIFKNKKLWAIVCGIIVVLIILILIFGRTKVDTITRVKKVLGPKFYRVECLNSSCDYIVASKGDKLGKSKTLIYNANGKKVASYTEKFDSNTKFSKNIAGVRSKYIIFRKVNFTNGETEGYIVATNRGKEKYTTKNALVSLTEGLISEKQDETYSIIDTKGKSIYSNVTEIKTYADDTIVSMNVKKEYIITDAYGKTMLNGYRIVKEVKDENGKAIYFVIEDSKKNAYNYYNIKKNQIIGDTFNGYSTGSNVGELIITKRENGSSKKLILTKDGKQIPVSKENDNQDLVDDIKSKLDSKKYDLIASSVVLSSQKSVLVKNKANNTFGAYNLSSKKYKAIIKYSKDNGSSTIYGLASNEKDAYFQINCSTNYCDKSTMVVYDLIGDQELYRLESNKNIAQNYTQYSDGFKVVKYSINSSDEYKSKYVLYGNDNKEIIKSDNQIVVVDKELLFGKNPSNTSLLLYKASSKKTLNDDSNLASKVNVGETYIYKYSDSSKTYLLNSVGKKLKTISNTSAALIYSKETVMYVENNRIFIVNPVAKKTRSYKLKNNEKITDNSGENIPPYRNTLFINNTVNKRIKVVNVNGRVVKTIRKSVINSVKYNEKTNNVIIITKRVKNNNNYYGFYIGK